MAITADIIEQVGYELRNDSGEFSDQELLTYVNKNLEILHTVLINSESELVRTGSGSFNTIAGTQSYDLTSSGIDITDMWLPHRVWTSQYEPMDMCSEDELYDGINNEEKGSTGCRARPQEYCLVGDYMWFKEVPDVVYTVNIKYFPEHTNVRLDSTMPYRGIFNQKLVQGVLMTAKNRNEMNVNVEASLLALYESAAFNLIKRRAYIPKQFSISSKVYGSK